jgi:hypothetical protein
MAELVVKAVQKLNLIHLSAFRQINQLWQTKAVKIVQFKLKQVMPEESDQKDLSEPVIMKFR